MKLSKWETSLFFTVLLSKHNECKTFLFANSTIWHKTHSYILDLETVQECLCKLAMKHMTLHSRNEHFSTKSGHCETYQNQHFNFVNSSLQNLIFQSPFGPWNSGYALKKIFLFQNIRLNKQILTFPRCFISKGKKVYRTRAIITCGLYTFHPIFEGQNVFF